jgi:cyclophilin family peptidyl-prolyl cis-trans isomerase
MQTKFLTTILIFMLVACSGNQSTAVEKNEKEQKVLVETDYGNMVIVLFNETPKHRDNFVKLVKDGFYNDLLFHRVINEFMIQTGDPNSKNAKANEHLGGGGPGYTIDAEIVDGLYHQKGALAAARQGNNVNPERKSSGSQFYIVHGKIWNDSMIVQFEDRQKYQHVRAKAMELYNNRLDEIKQLQAAGKIDSISAIEIEIMEKAENEIDEKLYTFNQKRRQIYSTLGGAPHLDGEYTVFGQVVEGIDVIDSIAKVKTNKQNRPLDDIKISMKLIK